MDEKIYDQIIGYIGKAIALLFYTEILNQNTAFLVHKNTIHKSEEMIESYLCLIWSSLSEVLDEKIHDQIWGILVYFGKAIALLFYTEILNQNTAFLVHKNTIQKSEELIETYLGLIWSCLSEVLDEKIHDQKWGILVSILVRL